MYKDQRQLIKKRQIKAARRKLAIVMVAVSVVIGACAACGVGTHVDAKTKEAVQTQKYYTSIEIKEGDSLWSIAKSYMGDDYDSIYEYINELKAINALDSDRINEAEYLTVAYYL